MARCDTTRARSSIILTLRNRHAVTHENSRKRALRDITLRNINRYQNHDVKPQLFDIFCIVVAKQSNDHIKKSRAREKKRKAVMQTQTRSMVMREWPASAEESLISLMEKWIDSSVRFRMVRNSCCETMHSYGTCWLVFLESRIHN